VNYLSVGNYCITHEEVKSNLYSRKLRHKAFKKGDEAYTSGLEVTNSIKAKKRRKEKDSIRAKFILRISIITARNLAIGKKIAPRNSRKNLL